MTYSDVRERGSGIGNLHVTVPFCSGVISQCNGKISRIYETHQPKGFEVTCYKFSSLSALASFRLSFIRNDG